VTTVRLQSVGDISTAHVLGAISRGEALDELLLLCEEAVETLDVNAAERSVIEDLLLVALVRDVRQWPALAAAVAAGELMPAGAVDETN
jgi:hypothetical protein